MESKTEIRPFGMKDKLAYMAGDVGCNLVLTMANSYLLVFYTKVMGVSAAIVSTLFMLARFVDAFTDVAVGRLVDTHSDKRGDRFRPWIACFSIPLVITSCLMYNYFLAGAAMGVKVAWLIVTYILFGSICYTAVNIPYGAMSNVISPDPAHRSGLSVWRNAGSQIGGLILGVVLPLMVYVKDADGNDVASGSRFLLTAVILGVLALVCLFLCWKGSVERVHLTDKPAGEKQENSLKVILSLFKDRAILMNFLQSIFVYAAIQVFMTFNQFLFLDYFGNTSLSGLASVVMFIGMMLTAPIATPLGKKFGKKEISVVGLGLSSVSYAVLFFARVSSPFVYFIFAFLAFFGLGIVSMVGYAMLNDCVDNYLLNTGEQVAGTLYATNSFIRKLAGAVSTGIGGWGLAWIGYDELSAVQTETVRQSIYTLSIGLMTLCFIISLIFLCFFPLNKKRVEENTARIAEMHKNEENQNA